MENVVKMNEFELAVDFCEDAIKLTVVALKNTDGAWSLMIQNQAGICTNWWETFESAQFAIEVGLKAIKDEGAEEFSSVEGFEYLSDRDV